MRFGKGVAIASSILCLSSFPLARAQDKLPTRFSGKQPFTDSLLLNKQEQEKQKPVLESLFKLMPGEEKIFERRVNDITLFIVTNKRALFLIQNPKKNDSSVNVLEMVVELPNILSKNDRIVGAALSPANDIVYLLLRSGKVKVFMLEISMLDTYWALPLADPIGSCDKGFLSCNSSNGWTGFVCKDLSFILWMRVVNKGSEIGGNLSCEYPKPLDITNPDALPLTLEDAQNGCMLKIGDRTKMLNAPLD